MKHILILALLLWGHSTKAHSDTLKELFDRSDLIVVGAFPHEGDFEGYMGSGPISSPDMPQIKYREFLPKMHVISVLKGTPKANSDFRISLTLATSDKDTKPFVPQVGQPYIILLEDRLKREPNSDHKLGDETIYFRNFDYFFSVLPLDQAALIRLKDLVKAEQPAPSGGGQPSN